MYNFDVLLERRHTDSTKWDAMERDYGRDDLMPFWVADADFPVLPEINQALQERSGEDDQGEDQHHDRSPRSLQPVAPGFFPDRGRLFRDGFFLDGNQQAQNIGFQLFLLPSGEGQAVDDFAYRADQVRYRFHTFSRLKDCSTSSQ